MLDAKIGRNALALLQTPLLPPSEAVLSILLNEMTAFPDYFAIVLDGYHVIYARPVICPTDIHHTKPAIVAYSSGTGRRLWTESLWHWPKTSKSEATWISANVFRRHLRGLPLTRIGILVGELFYRSKITKNRPFGSQK